MLHGNVRYILYIIHVKSQNGDCILKERYSLPFSASFVCLCSSNDYCFFYTLSLLLHASCHYDDCKAKEKRKSGQHLICISSVALLPYFCACLTLALHLSLYEDLENGGTGRRRLCLFLLDSSHLIGNTVCV